MEGRTQEQNDKWHTYLLHMEQNRIPLRSLTHKPDGCKYVGHCKDGRTPSKTEQARGLPCG
jgi:hypothetical protein